MIRYRLKELIAEKEFQEDRRITLEEITQTTGISRPTLSRIANTKGYSTTTEILDKLCIYFKCGLNQLAEFVPEKEIKNRGCD
ncbi:MAG: helix-turn-helix domain-containing protein [Candidatus Thiodiazotropha endolucinida]